MDSEKFCLRWNDFESNISVAFQELRADKDFFDVTLACEEEQLQAHKVILSACSPFFRNILRRNPHQNPLLYLKGVKYADLQAVLNFMYHGEVNVAQEELNSFLAVAEDLKVKGLTQSHSNHASSLKEPAKEKFNSAPNPHPPKPRPPDFEPAAVVVPPKRMKPNPPPVLTSFATAIDDDIQEVVPVKQEPRDAPPTPRKQPFIPQPTLPVAVVPQPQNDHAGQLQEQDNNIAYQGDETYDEYGQYGEDGAYVDQNMGQVEGGKDHGLSVPEDLYRYVGPMPDGSNSFICLICTSYSHKKRANVRNHIETKHFKGVFIYQCDICQQFKRSKTELYSCKSNHKKEQLMNLLK